MFKVSSIYGAIGVMLFLVAIYLVLEHGAAATQIITAGGTSGGGILKILQGRG